MIWEWVKHGLPPELQAEKARSTDSEDEDGRDR